MQQFKNGSHLNKIKMNNKHNEKQELKIATLNLCLGLKNKRLEVERLLMDINIKILCLQEVEVENNLDSKLLSLKDYQFELETNSIKSRTGIYIANDISYRRMFTLEGVDSNMVIIDVEGLESVKRIINVYRSFNPQNNVNARTKFIYQLSIIKNAMCNKCLVIGDFNLDYSRVNDVNYHNKLLFNDFEDALSEFELNQVVNCTTWSRLVGTVLKKSTLDHVYVKDQQQYHVVRMPLELVGSDLGFG